MQTEPLFTDIARFIWATRYRYQNGNGEHDARIQDTWRRLAHALASVETKHRNTWEQRFYAVLEAFRFLPGGRVIAGAGTNKRVTLFNCFVMGLIEDSVEGIFDALKQGALTMQQGGGIGYDFSTLRPKGMRVRGGGGIASGPVSFMRIWDNMCDTLLSTGNRRGAMMATLRCDHPDIEAFIDVKRDPTALRYFNLSVQITDEFMRAAHADEPWPLMFPANQTGAQTAHGQDRQILRRWSNTDSPIPCRVLRVVGARDLWNRIMRATYDYAEPGVLFVDQINRANNLWYREHITATNPCGEVPLPPYGACNLGSINLTQFVSKPFSVDARLDLERIERTVRTATRMLDNVIELSRFPLPEQLALAKDARRVGLGITGLADALIMLGMRYGDESSYPLLSELMACICHTAYRTSIELAKEKGVFPSFEKQPYLQGSFIQSLPDDIQSGIARCGLRNSHLIALAPAGTISLLANNVSSGLEPVFDFQHTRKVLDINEGSQVFSLEDYAWRLWRAIRGNQKLPESFVTAHDLSPQAHLRLQAVLQPYVDNAISKTINVPEGIAFADFRSLYEQAYTMGLKGCTTFRPNPVSGSILNTWEPKGARCCPV